MNRRILLEEIQKSVIARNESFARQFCPGESEDFIAQRLARCERNIVPLIDLYSWHNGTEPIRSFQQGRYITSYEKLSVVPREILVFPKLDLMLGHFDFWFEASKKHAFLKKVTKSFFPFLWDGGTTWLAVDIGSNGGEGVVIVQFESDDPVRCAYPSFDACLFDLLQANLHNKNLSFE